ncbi:hypothetical protein [Streptacidiphilus rugosus]|uniref:hypothetical protein n=1 Tax=Streptacidiphilus rugosus TaxID=405783 RepID=UPI00056724AB|nr:hypothetical protein [Streptacidiphilus rugosus]
MRAPRSATRLAWLSLTPEPEQLLPDVLALLRSPDDEPSAPGDAAGQVRAERRRIERLVLRGNARSWLAGLDEAVSLVGRAAREGRPAQLAPALTAAEVLADHCRLLIGLPGDHYARTARHRADLDHAARRLRHRLAAGARPDATREEPTCSR